MYTLEFDKFEKLNVQKRKVTKKKEMESEQTENRIDDSQ